MERFLLMLLQVWREACRQIRLEESSAAILETLAARMPLDWLLVRYYDSAGARLESLTFTGRGCAPSDNELDLSAAGLEQLLRWCNRQEPLQGTPTALREQMPGLLPDGLEGEVLTAGLVLKGEPIGALLLGSLRSGGFGSEHAPMLLELLEPLAVAVRNDRYVRELSTRREAAEADRESLLARLGRQDLTDTLVGAESGLKEVMRRVDLVARADTPVLILGETGSGKEVVARAIHNRSRRAAGPFVRVNCGAIPPELIDSELFGHERGSFTGATSLRKGWFERADGGTLFLDEVGELSPGAQVRLLRILQDGSFQRVGGQRLLHVDVRVVAATHRELQAMVTQQRFREDLLYRINVFPIHLPALRERVQDIPAMATHFALRSARRLGLPQQLPDTADIARLLDYPWPGNVRELAAVIERAAILGDGRGLEVGQALGVTSVPPAPSTVPQAEPQTAALTVVETLDQINRRHIELVLRRSLGRIDGPFGAARQLGINPHTLRARMRKLGIDWRGFRVTAP